MIHFSVTQLDSGDRELRLEGTNTFVGWIDQGRRMVDSRGPWTEWMFTPSDSANPSSPVRRTISEAYTDARNYAAGVR